MAASRLSGATLVVASHNAGKVREIGDLLAPLGVRARSAKELGLPEPDETGGTFDANARLKAEAARDGAKMMALADDSGLEVEALGGAPGIYSARWAGETRDFGAAMARVERELAAIPSASRRARFVCALAVAYPDGRATEVFEGTVDGTLTFPPRGTKGFGYDPIFVPDGHTITFGEMEPDAKHAISHRARAFAKLLAAFGERR
ncbi:MAG: RdgB/HAM1 family non-canonical purine NTP pyrophosphatase [Gemmatimonas sp.]